MILPIECAALCIIFTLIILPAQYKDPISMIMSYPPNVIKRVEQLPQYEGCIKEREKKHMSKEDKKKGRKNKARYKDKRIFHDYVYDAEKRL